MVCSRCATRRLRKPQKRLIGRYGLRGVDSPVTPANREIYREFCRFRLYSAVFASNLEVNSEGYRPNYLLNRTGDFSHGTGKFLDRTGEPAKGMMVCGGVGIRQDCT
jgi:hypothetical protein